MQLSKLWLLYLERYHFRSDGVCGCDIIVPFSYGPSVVSPFVELTLTLLFGARPWMKFWWDSRFAIAISIARTGDGDLYENQSVEIEG